MTAAVSLGLGMALRPHDWTDERMRPAASHEPARVLIR